MHVLLHRIVIVYSSMITIPSHHDQTIYYCSLYTHGFNNKTSLLVRSIDQISKFPLVALQLHSLVSELQRL